MSDPGPLGGQNPFEGLPFFGDLAKLFSGQGPMQWEVARQVAAWVATDGQPEANIEPLDRIRWEELGRVAELHVSEVTGLSTSPAGRAATIAAATRGRWTAATLDAYRPLLERLASSLGQPPVLGSEPGQDDDPTAQLLGNLGSMMNPLLLGLQGGFMVGHLARRSLGQYDLPVPRAASDELLVVAPNVEGFATDWSLPVDDVRLWVCIDLIAHHAVLGRPHVRQRLTELLESYASGFQPDPTRLEEKLGAIDPSNPASWQEALGDPTSLVGAMQTDAQRALLPRLDALVAAIEGYVDWVMDQVGGRLIASFSQLQEALRRRRVQRNDGDRFVEELFGLHVDQRQYERGSAFVGGVVERAGDAGLARLWHSERELPTPAEVDAPGLWLERIDLPD